MLPPGQQLAAADRWQIIGERQPRASDAPWSLTIAGLIERPQCWSLEQIQAMPQVTQAIDIHCVTRWSKLGMRWTGVPLEDLLSQAGPTPEAGFISLVARSDRNHNTSLKLADAISLGALVALSCDGQPLDSSHGGPIRLVLSDRYFYKSLKWLERIELLEHDQLGFWEATAGYHNGANPWGEERYLTSDLDRRETARLLASRDVSDRELRGFDAAGRSLANFQARQAILRDSNFERAELTGSCFADANLSNARFANADLRNVSFAGADLEGADFIAADLRGADFRGAALTAATFVSADWPRAGFRAAIFDAQTRIDLAALDQLMPQQAEFLASFVNRT